ncbi:MAG: hypothetical protein CMH60_03535, partial [Myxococcales bacterium]|nr:hypothetical protein [Myxococcales bacterium]
FLIAFLAAFGLTWLYFLPQQSGMSDLSTPPTPPPPKIAAPTEPEPAVAPPTLVNVSFVANGTGDLYIDGEEAAKGFYNTMAKELPPGKHTALLVGKTKVDRQEFEVFADGATPPVEFDVRPDKQATKAKFKQVTFRLPNTWANIFLGDNPKPIAKNKMGLFSLPLRYGIHELKFANPKAQPLTKLLKVNATEPTGPVEILLEPLQARLRVEGAPDGSLLDVAGKRYLINATTRDTPIFVPIPAGKGKHNYEIQVSKDNQVFRSTLTFRPGEEQKLNVQFQDI